MAGLGLVVVLGSQASRAPGKAAKNRTLQVVSPVLVGPLGGLWLSKRMPGEGLSFHAELQVHVTIETFIELPCDIQPQLQRAATPMRSAAYTLPPRRA